MVLLGYEAGTKGYRMYDPVTKRLYISRDVKFEEHVGWNQDSAENAESTEPETDTSIIRFQVTVPDQVIQNHPQISDESGDFSGGNNSGGVVSGGGGNSPLLSPQSLVTPVLSPTQSQNLGASTFGNYNSPGSLIDTGAGHNLRYRTLTDLYQNSEEVHDFEYSGVCMLAADEPVSVESALADQNWRDAMYSELQAIENNNTQSWPDLPKGHRAIGLKWVFKLKKDAAGNVLKHKARCWWLKQLGMY